MVQRKHPNLRLWIEYGLILLVIILGTTTVSSVSAIDKLRPELTLYEKIVLMLPGCGNPP